MVPLAGGAAAAKKPSGCFERTYDAAHLRDHPGQQVRRLSLRLEDSRYDVGKTEFGMELRIRGKPQIWRAGGRCEPGGAGWKCRPDTDGAAELLITMQGRNLRLSNPGRLKIFDDVTGPDLNEMVLGGPGDLSFLLLPARQATCRARRP